ncbi:related to multidrug resistance protein fnx1 [Cephalotrichum gorgonifer]|uniref:Related to multidrug resistance protein fnx1 n=1 Tax=Cephalotrichum gorgonifer TaxID=2041049 RepID=A0AAE8SRE5_9PEZI|nr:related to multidrug resistance protein fnx1 [Cephalotrichum gorgonifer]
MTGSRGDPAISASLPPATEVTEATPLIGNGSQPKATAAVADEERTVLAAEVSPARLWLIMGTSWIGVFIGAIDSTVFATLSSPIASEFKSGSIFSWLATAYLISNAACQPISGRLTDIFGRGPGLVFSNLAFAAGNLICALATDQYVMIFGRVVAGIGGGGLMAISTFLGTDLVPLRKRGVVQGIGNICYGSGAMLGGIFGGFVNDHTAMGWRLAFFALVPPSLISAVLVGILVRVPPKQSDKSYLSRIDFGGVILTVGFLVSLLLGLNAGGNLVPWLHPLPIAAVSTSVVLFVAFWIWESRALQPIIPVRLLLDRTVAAACFANLVATMAMMQVIFYTPMYLQVKGYSATNAGATLLASSAGVAGCSVSSGLIMKKTGKYYSLGVSVTSMFALGIAGLGLAGLATLDGESPYWRVPVSLFLAGGGYGSLLTVTVLACIAAVDHSQQAVVTSATYLARGLGGTVGITAASAVYQNILKSHLWARFGDEPGAADIIRRVRDDLEEIGKLPPGWYDGVMLSFMEAFRGVWFMMFGLVIMAVFFMTLLRQHTLHSTLSRTSSD